MRTFYKVFLVIFLVFIGFNLYAVDWKKAVFSEDNMRYIYSAVAAFFGLILVFVLDTWSRLANK